MFFSLQYLIFVRYLYIVSNLNNMDEQMYCEGMFILDTFLVMGINFTYYQPNTHTAHTCKSFLGNSVDSLTS